MGGQTYKREYIGAVTYYSALKKKETPVDAYNMYEPWGHCAR